MAHIYLHFVVLTLLPIHTTATICGTPNPCVGSNLECSGFEACQGDTLLCQDNEDCVIICTSGQRSCSRATMDATQANSLTVYCGSSSDSNSDQCNDIALKATNIDGDIHIICSGPTSGGGQHTCSYSNITATGSNSLTVDCNGFTSCNAVHINCAEDCNINCNNNQNHVCGGMSITCGTGNCIIDCSGAGDKCINMGPIDISQSSNFQCIGTTECDSVNSNLITGSPTTSTTTDNPTPAPTLNPTFNPTTKAPTTKIPTTSEPTGVATCPKDLLTCWPGGPSVGRVPPTCEFPPCPTREPTTDIPTTNTPTATSAMTDNPTYEPSVISSTKTPTISTTKTPTVSTTQAEGGVNVYTTLELDSSAENDAVYGDTGSPAWVYVAAVLALILITVAGILICKKKRKSNKVHYHFDDNVKGTEGTYNKNRILVGSMSQKTGEGNQNVSVETAGVDEYLVDTNIVNNIMMDDVVDDMNEYETPMGDESNDIEMQNMDEGDGEMIINDQDETPSGNMITSGNDQFDEEGTDPDVDDILDDTMPNNNLNSTVQ